MRPSVHMYATVVHRAVMVPATVCTSEDSPPRAKNIPVATPARASHNFRLVSLRMISFMQFCSFLLPFF